MCGCVCGFLYVCMHLCVFMATKKSAAKKSMNFTTPHLVKTS